MLNFQWVTSEITLNSKELKGFRKYLKLPQDMLGKIFQLDQLDEITHVSLQKKTLKTSQNRGNYLV